MLQLKDHITIAAITTLVLKQTSNLILDQRRHALSVAFVDRVKPISVGDAMSWRAIPARSSWRSSTVTANHVNGGFATCSDHSSQ